MSTSERFLLDPSPGGLLTPTPGAAITSSEFSRVPADSGRIVVVPSSPNHEQDLKKSLRYDLPSFQGQKKESGVSVHKAGGGGQKDIFSGSRGGSHRVVKEDLKDTRFVYVNDPDRTCLVNSIAGNKVSTSKYTLLTFLPRNLFEQFQRVAYIYFLIIVALNQIPALAVFGRTASIFPLAFVLIATALKDAYEDWARHRSDKVENNRTSMVFDGGYYKPKKWKHIRVGDVVKVHANEIVAADMVLLATSERSGVAYLETMNLDGESNLKTRYAKQETASKKPEEEAVGGTLICELPNRNIYEFQAYLDIDGTHIPLGPNNIILRGCELKNTSWVVGVVVYAGKDTKAMLNNSGAQSKRSRLEQQMNRETMWLGLILLVLCFVGGIGMGVWVQENHDYLNKLPFYRKKDYEEDEDYRYYGVLGEAIVSFLSCIIVFQVMVPIALYISLELVRLWQSHFMTRDGEMYHAGSSSRFQCRALNINEDLGQVKYVFSDKTGTLTENKMEFHSASVFGRDYDNAQVTISAVGNDEGMISADDSAILGEQIWKPKVGSKVDPKLFRLLQGPADTQERKAAHEYMLVLAACNTVVPTRVQLAANGQLEMKAASNDSEPGLSGFIEYQGESPDEQALVAAAASYGYVLLERNSDNILINVMGTPYRYQILGVHEFDSVRKRMSVVIQCPDGTLKLLVKGADNAVMDIVRREEDEEDGSEAKLRASLVDTTNRHLQSYSRHGLRTLVIASRELDAKLYENWRYNYLIASTALHDRAGLLRETSQMVEISVDLLGATAIEDRLQEGVPDTIALLREAGIKVWVLTGDKQETAISIGYSCKLLTHSMQKLIVRESTREGTLETLVSLKSKYLISSATGTSVSSECPPELENVEDSARASTDSNDSSDGSVSSSDEAPGSNESVKQLALIIDGNTLVHALHRDVEQQLFEVARACRVVICCRVAPLQKAAVVNLIKRKTGELTLAIGDGANDVSMIQMADIGVGLSGQEGRQAVMASDFAMGQFRFLKRLLLVHGHWNYHRLSYMILYNFYRNAVFVLMLFWYILYTAFSPSNAITDWSLVFYSLIYTSVPTIVVGTLDKDLSHRTLLTFPALYGAGQRGEAYNQRLFWLTMVDTIWQSLVLFYVPYMSYRHSDVDLYGLGSIWTLGVVVLVNIHLAMDVQRWNWLAHASIWGSIAATFGVLLFLDSLLIDDFLLQYGTMKHIMVQAAYWLDLLLIIPIALLPRLCVIVVKQRFFPSDIQIAREGEIRGTLKLSRSERPFVTELGRLPPA
ncbi:hypothetical protein R1sor_023855 [Riccia sorocarpa]|uniref:Phospholipid-transporting ATPase n=1 Tax=Riccia sorocarpa TaxID=122646 RepID=A0ABD3GUR1_9MARC